MSDRHTADTITDDELDALYARLDLAEHEAETSVAAAAQLTTLVGKRSEKAEKTAKAQRERARIAEGELRVLRAGLRANGADPTQIQNLWAQIRLRNRQWREEKQRAEAAERQARILTAVDEGRAHGAQRVMDERDRAQQRGDRAEKLAADRADQIKNLRYQWAACRTRLAKQEDETMRQHERAVQTEAAIERVQALAERWRYTSDRKEGPLRELRQALAVPAPAATQATELETTARVASALHRSAEADVTRVLELHERWVKAGPPPLGTSLARWWDRRLADLHDAIQPADQTTEK